MTKTNSGQRTPLIVDKCYVINLRTNESRWTSFGEGRDNWVSAFGVAPERFDAVYGVELEGFDKAPWFTPRISEQRKRAWGGKAGAILSHAGVIRDALEQGYEQILVLEDDSYVADDRLQDWLDGLVPMIQALPEDWVSINLCTADPVTPCRVVSTYNEYRLIEVAGAFGAVAYLLNGRYLRQLAAELPTQQNIWEWVARHKTIDRWYSQNLTLLGGVYVFSPAVVGHRNGASNISMSADESWLMDFSLQDVPITGGALAFRLKLAARRSLNAVGRALSLLRLWGKRRRGL